MVCKDKPGIDLHIHSNASDGTLTPSEILSEAARLGLGAIAITDHDTIEGSRESLASGIPPATAFLTGVEISTSPPPSFSFSGSFHILGYSIRLEDPILNRTLDTLQKARNNRADRILQRLEGLGIHLSPAEIAKEAGEGQIGRPHIARCMVKNGLVGSIDEAFDRYLGKGKPGYVDKYRLECEEAIAMIRSAEGFAVMAHPYLLRIEDPEIERLVVILKGMGLVGIEAYYPEHPPERTDFYRDLAGRHGLLVTGGTDFHGGLKPEIEMGTGRGDFSVPYGILEEILKTPYEVIWRTPRPLSDSFSETTQPVDYTDLEGSIDYVFRDKSLLDEALRHSSYVNEQNEPSLKDNERLEFLGDAMVNLAVGHLLMEYYPEHREGDLSRMRANLVNESRLAGLARNVELGAFIRLGKGELLTGGQEKSSILANTYEAVVAAIYRDGGFDAAFTMIRRHFSPLVESMRISEANRDYKSQLQELTQLTHGGVPRYDVIQEYGPDHDKTFRVRLKMRSLSTEGSGKSKKTAEQEAARKALAILEPE